MRIVSPHAARDALMHLCGYIGLPSVREAMIVARGVFAEMRAEPEGGLAGV